MRVMIEYKSKNYEMNTASNSTVSELKNKLHTKFDIPPDQQCVIFEDKPLIDNNATLSNYTLVDEPKFVLKKNNLDHKLMNLLISHDLFLNLFDILNDDEYDINLLSEMTEDDVQQFCAEFNLSEEQHMQFKRLMRIIRDYDALQYKEQQIQLKKADHRIDILIIGDIGVGKTSLRHRFLYDAFEEKYADSPTIAAEPKSKKIEVGNHKIVEMNVSDTAGQEMHDSLPRQFYRKGDCVIICYDISDPQSFKSVIEWVDTIDNYGNDDAVVMLIGCKSDLSSENRLEYEQKAVQIINRQEWKKYSTFYAECSAKSGDNVRNIFNVAAEMVLERISGHDSLEHQRKMSNISLTNADVYSKVSCCCATAM